MDRRTFLRTASGAGGTLAVAGCLGDGDDSGESISNIGEGPPTYSRPAYSAWPPAESHADGAVVAVSMRLDIAQGVQQALAAGRLPADEPLVGLPAAGGAAIPEAVGTLTSYPFAAPLRRAINIAAGTDPTDAGITGNDTVIDPVDTSVAGVIEEPTVAGNETATAANGTTTAGNATIQDGNATAPATESQDTNVPVVDTLGIEVTEITLVDDLLVCHGSYDPTVIADRYTAGFEAVDQQRGVSIYEATDGPLAFAVSDDVLVVPTERSTRETPAETVLAHGVSGYVTTVGRMVDDEDGRWLFESTGEAALAVAVWGTDDPRAAVASVDPDSRAVDGKSLLASADGLVSTLDVTTDEETVTGADGRFAGLFSTAAPTEDELQENFVGSGSDGEVFVDAERVHVMATFGSD